MSALVEYGAERVTDGWRSRVWANGERRDILGLVHPSRELAIEAASDEAVVLAADSYLGRGGVTVRLRAEPATPPVLGMESTIAELSAECARLGVTSLAVCGSSAGWHAELVPAPPDTGHVGWSPQRYVTQTLASPGLALLEALRRVALVRAGGGL